MTSEEKVLRDMLPKPDASWPNEPIGGSNPYYRCSACGRSDPEISYAGHYKGCDWADEQERRRAALVALDAALVAAREEGRRDGFEKARGMAVGVAESFGVPHNVVAERIRAMRDGAGEAEGPSFCGWCHHARHEGHACPATYEGPAGHDLQCRCVGGQRP